MPMPLPIVPSEPNRATTAPSVGHDQRAGGGGAVGVARGGAPERFAAAAEGRDEAGGADRGGAVDAEVDGRRVLVLVLVLVRVGVGCLVATAGARARGAAAT
jgi:hypothetical protein